MFEPENILTPNECYEYLVNGNLPDDFTERLHAQAKMQLECAEGQCSNCDGVQDMNMVFRDWWAKSPSWCPFCCDGEGKSAWERYKKRRG